MASKVKRHGSAVKRRKWSGTWENRKSKKRKKMVEWMQHGQSRVTPRKGFSSQQYISDEKPYPSPSLRPTQSDIQPARTTSRIIISYLPIRFLLLKLFYLSPLNVFSQICNLSLQPVHWNTTLGVTFSSMCVPVSLTCFQSAWCRGIMNTGGVVCRLVAGITKPIFEKSSEAVSECEKKRAYQVEKKVKLTCWNS